MDIIETEDASRQHPTLFLDVEAQSYLREAGKWSSFLGIIGFIICGLILILSFTIGSIMAKMNEMTQGTTSAAIYAGMGGFISLIYILFDIVYFFFSLYLYQFGTRIKNGVLFSDNSQVTNALGKLKSFFKLWGVITIVAMCLYALIIVVAIVIGIGASTLLHH